jgi:hypothetical protein
MWRVEWILACYVAHTDIHGIQIVMRNSSANQMPVSNTILPEQVVIHPLVLLSVVDHYNRAARNTKKRVVGVLLGQVKGKTVNIANSYARTVFMGEDARRLTQNKYRLKRMTRTVQFGFWTIIITKPCTTCSKR